MVAGPCASGRKDARWRLVAASRERSFAGPPRLRLAGFVMLPYPTEHMFYLSSKKVFTVFKKGVIF
jgi:hypothetical protein